MKPIHFHNSLFDFFVLTIYSFLDYNVYFSRKIIHSFLTAVGSNPPATTKLDTSGMDNRLYPIEHHQPPLIQMIYNQIHIFHLTCNLTFNQQHYTLQKSKRNLHRKIPLYELILIFHV